MDFSPADLFRSTKTGSRSSLDRVNKQLSASRGTFRQKVHIGVLVATVALVAYGAIIIWSASQFKADASFSRHLLGIGIGTVLAVMVWRTDLRGMPFAWTLTLRPIPSLGRSTTVAASSAAAVRKPAPWRPSNSPRSLSWPS